MNKHKRNLIIIIIIIVFLVFDIFLGVFLIKQKRIHDKEVAIARMREKKRMEQERIVNRAVSHVYSHRGASDEEIEHTERAYDLAIKYGSKNIEQDIVLSKDGTLYVSHDLSAGRLTGNYSYYSNMTDEEIESLRTSDGQKILSLREVFNKYQKKVNYIIELKNTDNRIVKAFCDLVDEFSFGNRIVVQCFDAGVLKMLEEKYPDMPKLYLCMDQQSLNYSVGLDFVDIVSIQDYLMTDDNCETIHNSGKKVNVWVLDSEVQINRAIELNVDTYFTDHTKLAIDIEKKAKRNR